MTCEDDLWDYHWEKSQRSETVVETMGMSIESKLPAGGAEVKSMAQFSNRPIPAEKPTIEWYLEHTVICCVCRTTLFVNVSVWNENGFLSYTSIRPTDLAEKLAKFKAVQQRAGRRRNSNSSLFQCQKRETGRRIR